MAVLVLVEYNQKGLDPVTHAVIAAAHLLSEEVVACVIGTQCKTIAEQVATEAPVTRVLLADDSVFAHQLAENTAALIATLARSFTHVLAPATTFGKNILPRAAALCDAVCISDITQIKDMHTYVRPIYAGNAFATVQTQAPLTFLTVRPTAFNPIATQNPAAAPIEKISQAISDAGTVWLSDDTVKSERPELTAAKIIIAGGRGLQSADQFQLLYRIADRLNAAVGASRAAVDAGFVPNNLQVGQTGKVVAPQLYIAVGISGAIQHVAGIKDSRVIVAINKDAKAPIFQVADYGLVGDLFEILPELEQALVKLGY